MSEHNRNKKYQKQIRYTLFLVIFATLALSIFGPSSINSVFAVEDKQKNIETVENFLVKAYDQKDPENAVAEYLSEDFMSVGLVGQSDKEQISKNIAMVHEILPDLVRTSETAVADEDGDFIIVFSKWSSSGGDAETADLFKVIDGKIMEHLQSSKYSDKIVESLKTNSSAETTNNNSTNM
ncbi:MAG: hypothetical protein ACPKPY_01120 [Nitrososphaeraceae archaeon]